MPLDRPHPLVPIHLDDKQPSYLVVAGEHPLLTHLCAHITLFVLDKLLAG